MQLDVCYQRLRDYCAGIEPEYRNVSWEHARRMRLLAHWRSRCHYGWWEAAGLETQAHDIEMEVLRQAYATIKPGIQPGKT